MWLTSVLRFLRRLQKPPTIHPAMPWSFRRDFHIDLSASYGSYLLESNLRPVALQTPPDLVAGDKLPVRIYLWERDATTGDPVAVVTPEGTSMVFAGRPANAPLDSSLLFLSSNLAESETEPGVWEGTLDLNTVALHNHLASQTTGEITILGEIELRSSDATPNRQSIQFDLNARRQVYAGVEGEAAALLARTHIITTSPPSNGATAQVDVTWNSVSMADGQTLTIGTETYTLKRIGNDPSLNEWDGTAEGLDWFLGSHPQVWSYIVGATAIRIFAKNAGSIGNSIAVSGTLAGLVAGAGSLAGGVNSVPIADYPGQLLILRPFATVMESLEVQLYAAVSSGHTRWKRID